MSCRELALNAPPTQRSSPAHGGNPRHESKPTAKPRSHETAHHSIISGISGQCTNQPTQSHTTHRYTTSGLQNAALCKLLNCGVHRWAATSGKWQWPMAGGQRSMARPRWPALVARPPQPGPGSAPASLRTYAPTHLHTYTPITLHKRCLPPASPWILHLACSLIVCMQSGTQLHPFPCQISSPDVGHPVSTLSTMPHGWAATAQLLRIGSGWPKRPRW
jgi:hypothetical protein